MSTNPSTPGLFHRTVEASTGSPPHPGLLLLHGRGSNEDDLLLLGHEIDPRLVVVSARGPFTLAPGAYYWYDLEASLAGRPSKESIEYSLGLVSDLLRDMVDRYGVDDDQLYVGGFSMGGAMTAAAILTLPRQVRGGIILSGYLPLRSNLDFMPEEIAAHPVFQGHGTADELLPVELGRMTRDHFLGTPAVLTYREYPVGHEVSPQELNDIGDWMRGELDSDTS